MIYGYIRVSTNKQTMENQKYEIKNYAKQNNFKVNRWISETISGMITLEKRKLGAVIKVMKKGDILVCTEISRLGRNILQIMKILNLCMQKDIQVWTIKDRYKLGADIQSKVLAFAFSLSAEIERNLISQRTKEALFRLRADGRKLGRYAGSKNKHYMLDDKKQEVIRLLTEKRTKRYIARYFGVSTTTIYNFMARHNLDFNTTRSADADDS